jgi:hypothetical protein
MGRSMRIAIVSLMVISFYAFADITVQNTTESTLMVTAILMGAPNASFVVEPDTLQDKPYKCAYDIVIKAMNGEIVGQQVTYHLGNTPCRNMLRLKAYKELSKLGVKTY